MLRLRGISLGVNFNICNWSRGLAAKEREELIATPLSLINQEVKTSKDQVILNS